MGTGKHKGARVGCMEKHNTHNSQAEKKKLNHEKRRHTRAHTHKEETRTERVTRRSETMQKHLCKNIITNIVYTKYFVMCNKRKLA